MVDPLWTEKNGAVFVYRTAAVITDGERVLLRRQLPEEFWTLPGGHVNMGEESEAALRRNLVDDLGQDVQIERLLWAVENRMDTPGQMFHEIGLYYLAHLLPGADWLTASGPFMVKIEQPDQPPLHLEFRWFPRDPAARAGVRILPEFLGEALNILSNFIQISENSGTKIWGVSGTIKIKA